MVYPAGPGQKRATQMKKTTTNKALAKKVGAKKAGANKAAASKAAAKTEPTIGAPPTDQELANHAALGKTDEPVDGELLDMKAAGKSRKLPASPAKAPKAAAKKAAEMPAPAKAKAPRTAKKTDAATNAFVPSKKDQVLALISGDGATLEQIMAATGWQKHTVRGFIAILGKKGTKIESFKSEAGARTYKAAK